MIVVATSGLNQCTYCVVAHGAILRISGKPAVVGPDRQQLPQSRHYAASEAYARFRGWVSQRAYEIEESDLQMLHQQGFTDDDIWDIAAISAFSVIQPHGQSQWHAAERRVLSDGTLTRKRSPFSISYSVPVEQGRDAVSVGSAQ